VSIVGAADVDEAKILGVVGPGFVSDTTLFWRGAWMALRGISSAMWKSAGRLVCVVECGLAVAIRPIVRRFHRLFAWIYRFER
jgi:hypothetical protein